jgi:hypothetical protein
MIILTQEQTEKLHLIDMLFGALSIEQLKEVTESEKVVAILKGTNSNPSVLSKLVNEHNTLHMEAGTTKVELASMKSDLHILIKLVLKPNDYSSHSDASGLKSKYGVY